MKFAEIVGYLEESEFEFLSIFRCTHSSHIIEILHDILFHGQRNFVWESDISGNSLFGKRNFVQHFVWGSEILWNISFVGIEIKLNVDEINKSFV